MRLQTQFRDLIFPAHAIRQKGFAGFILYRPALLVASVMCFGFRYSAEGDPWG